MPNKKKKYRRKSKAFKSKYFAYEQLPNGITLHAKIQTMKEWA